MYKNIFKVGSITLLIKPLGYVRDIFIASLSGISFYSDVLYFTLRIPFAFKTIFSSPYQAAFIPIFLNLKNVDESRAINHALTVFIISIIISMPLLVVIEINMDSIISFCNFDFIQGQKNHDFTVLIARIILPYLLFILLSATLLSILYSYEKFVLGSLLPIIINILSIFTLFMSQNLDTDKIIIFLSISIVFGSIVEVIILFFYLRKNISIRKFKFIKTDLNKFFKLLIPSISNDVIYQGTKFINVIYAAALVGGISSLYFASIVAALPIAIFGVTLSTVLIPKLSSLYISDKQKKINLIKDSLRLALLLILPTVAFLFFFSELLLSSLYQRGAFDLSATTKSSNLLKAYSIGIIPIIVNRILLILYYSELNTLKPFLMYLVAFVINMFLLYIFFNIFGLVGIALALSLSLCIYTILILLDLYLYGIIIFNGLLIFVFIKYSMLSFLMILCQKIIYINFLANYNLYGLVDVLILIIIGGLIFLTSLIVFDRKYIRQLKDHAIGLLR